MECFDKRMALEVIEDAFTAMGSPEGRGLAIGLCGAFYYVRAFEPRGVGGAGCEDCGRVAAQQRGPTGVPLAGAPMEPEEWGTQAIH